IAVGEQSAGPAERGNAELIQRAEDVLPETAVVAQQRSLLEDPSVNAPAQVFDKAAIDPGIDLADPAPGVDLDPRDAAHAAPLEARGPSSTGNRTRLGSADPLVIMARSTRIASSPVSWKGTRTEARGGTVWAAISMSSHPMTAQSSGTRRPSSRRKLSTPIAIVSFCAKMAVRSGRRDSNR